MKIITNKREIKEYVQNIKSKKLKIGFTPTLGCLHNGHVSLLKESKKNNDISVCSIFVNPIQFRKEKFIKYPRNIDSDIKILKDNEIDVLFLPSINKVFNDITIDELYEWQNDIKHKQINLFDVEIKTNFSFIRVSKTLTNKMSGRLHPWHFDGVCSIVYFLLKIITPNNTYLGKKDPQQVFIIEKMNNFFNMSTKINKVDILREENHTPFSSRNSILNNNQKLILSKISSIFKKYSDIIKENNKTIDIKERTRKDIQNLEYNGKIIVEDIDIIDQNTFNTIEKCNKNNLFYIDYLIDGIRLTDCYYKSFD